MELVNQGEIMSSQERTNKKHVYYWKENETLIFSVIVLIKS